MAEQIIRWYNESLDAFELEFDMKSDVKTRTLLHEKYDVFLYNIAMLLMYSQLTPQPVLLTVRKIDDHSLYYEDNKLFNGTRFVQLTSLQNIAMQTFIADNPKRMYLFGNSTVLPHEISTKHLSGMNVAMNTLLAKFNSDVNVRCYKDSDLTRDLLAYFVETNRVNAVAYHRIKRENCELKRQVETLGEQARVLCLEI
jgi:hypothetical protein